KNERSPKFRVAVDSKLPVVTVEEIQKSSPAWRTAAQVVTSNFDKLESAYAQAVHDQLPHETPQPAVRSVALYREAKTSRSPIYFVAERKYRAPSFPEDPSCGRITVMTGWLLPTASGALRLSDSKVFLTDCDGKDVRTAIPLAAVHVPDHAFWV